MKNVGTYPLFSLLKKAFSKAVTYLFACFVILFFGLQLNAFAAEPVSVTKDLKALDISKIGDKYLNRGNSLKISTAPDRDGIVRRVEIKPSVKSENTNWYVFALANDSNEQIDRYIVAPHYRMVNSGIIWPDLDKSRIIAITPSEGFTLEAQDDREADVFLITLNPGAVITLIAELNGDRLPSLTLWEPAVYKDTINSLTLYRGIVLGVAGLLAMFLTILFVVKSSAIFPATAALAWGVLAYICVDFGFWGRVVPLTEFSTAIWRAGTEVFLSAALLIFFSAYLNLHRWNKNISSVSIAWILGLAILMGVVLFDADIAAGIARISFTLTIILAGLMIFYLSFKGFDRAVMLLPTWVLAVAWIIANWLTVTNQVSNDIIQPALGGGLVLLVLLISFTVIQHAFTGSALSQGLVSDVEQQALALSGSGDILWDWDVTRNFIHCGDELGEILSIPTKEISGPKSNFSNLIHANDRERFTSILNTIVEHKRGRISQSFRMAGTENPYHWFKLKARPMLGVDGSVIRCIGTIEDVTDAKMAEERLLQDAVRDNLTGLENRELFVSRLDMVMQMAGRDNNIRPTVFHLNIDHFREANAEIGFAAGDIILLTVARRLSKILKNGDSVARLGGDQFSIMLLSEIKPEQIAIFADMVRTTLCAPIEHGGKEIELTGSIGIASWTSDIKDPNLLMRDAELAMLHAKHLGGNRIEPFRPAFRTGKDDSVILENDLKLAIQNKQITVLYQPIVNLEDYKVVGFEALVRWTHPKLGKVSPSDFIPIAETSGLINDLGNYVIQVATADFGKIHAANDGQTPFVSVNISSRQLLKDELLHSIKDSLEKSGLPASALKIELTENLVMSNPVYSNEVLKRIKALGVGLSLDDFGTGYSSLSYLMKFPFDTIKIDKSFIQARNKKERLIVLRSIIAMAHGLEHELIAEGVELESDVTELRQMGCEYAQGFLFGSAVDVGEVNKILQKEIDLSKH
ncbi:MAG: EAL domain-containing protein [Rhizobiales bacterium]|nr:EAL domain-containing protein [Hyphomicrobiales bacterium]